MSRAEAIRHQLRFDVARLGQAAARLQGVDDGLRALKHRLEARSRVLRDEAAGVAEPLEPEPALCPVTPIRSAQAQATAELARRAALGEVLRHAGTLPLLATMAVSRWLDALQSQLPADAAGEDPERHARAQALAKGHIDAGRLAHRMLRTMRRGTGMRSGCSQLVASVVVAELAPPALGGFVAEQIEEGMERALRFRGVRAEADALRAASAALREGARLLESMADRAEAAVAQLRDQADAVEDRVAADLAPRQSRRWGP